MSRNGTCENPILTVGPLSFSYHYNKMPELKLYEKNLLKFWKIEFELYLNKVI